jgi:apolipoprotein N-acyltransferase
LAAAFPPSPLAFLAFAGFAPLLWVVERRMSRRGPQSYLNLVALVYPAFFVWNALTCYWISLTALSVGEDERIPAFVAGVLAVVVNALLMTLPVVTYVFVRKRLNTPKLFLKYLIFIPFWVGFEFLHFRWDLTWSWLTLGHAFTYYPFYLQYLEFTGVLGTSVHTLVATAMLAGAVEAGATEQKISFKVVGLGVAWLIFPLALYPVLSRPGRFEPVGQINVRVVQPNVDPYNKFAVLSPDEQMRRFAELIRRPGVDTVDLAVLPETAVPVGLMAHDLKNTVYLGEIRDLVRQYPRLNVLTGAIIYRIYREGEKTTASTKTLFDGTDTVRYESYNAALMPESDDRYYVKSKLVPFTERTPFLEYARVLEAFNLTMGGHFGGFGLPDSLIVLRTRRGVGVAPLICYESEFGQTSAEIVRKGAQLLCVITNDGWFGESSGHIQHAHLASLRCIETRRDLARSANTGISLFGDLNGAYYPERLGWWKQGTIDRKLNLYAHTTFFMRYGDWPGRWAVMTAFALVVFAAFKRKAKAALRF